MVCANLLLANYARRPLQVPLNNNAWVGRLFVPEFIRLLEEHELIGVRKGTEKAKRNTRIWGEKALFQRFHGHVDYIPDKWVKLKDEDDQWIDYEPTEETERISKVLEKNYDLTKQARIEHDGIRLCTALHAVFRPGWTYGRAHTNTIFGYQHLTSEERLDITFDGEGAAELDYSGLHPRLLYALRATQNPPPVATSKSPTKRT